MNNLKILVKTNCPKNRILGFDEKRGALKVEIKAPPEDNKANIEIVKLFKREYGKEVEIVSGLKSKQKVLRFI